MRKGTGCYACFVLLSQQCYRPSTALLMFGKAGLLLSGLFVFVIYAVMLYALPLWKECDLQVCSKQVILVLDGSIDLSFGSLSTFFALCTVSRAYFISPLP